MKKTLILFLLGFSSFFYSCNNETGESDSTELLPKEVTNSTEFKNFIKSGKEVFIYNYEINSKIQKKLLADVNSVETKKFINNANKLNDTSINSKNKNKEESIEVLNSIAEDVSGKKIIGSEISKINEANANAFYDKFPEYKTDKKKQELLIIYFKKELDLNNFYKNDINKPTE